jgi:hypothetical protein
VLRPDQRGCEQVRALRQRLLDHGLPSLAGHRKGAYPPHLSLTVADHLEQVNVRSSDLALDAVRFAELAVFPSGVLHLVATPTARLTEVQAASHAGCTVDRVWPYYVPGSWTPHLTLGYGYSPEQAGRAGDLLHAELPLVLTGWSAWLEDSGTGEAWPIA